jgi:hypothetical protein
MAVYALSLKCINAWLFESASTHLTFFGPFLIQMLSIILFNKMTPEDSRESF